MISIVLATYDESENIIEMLRRVESVLSGEDYEILVVDDDSPDGTWRLVEEHGRVNPRVRSIRRITDRGLSSAIIEGFRQSRGDVLAVMDADMSHDETLLPSMLRAVRSEADLAMGSRRVPGGGAEKWPWYRRLCSEVATLLARSVLPQRINDPMCGFFVLRRGVYEKIRDRLRPRGYKILLEIVHRASPLRVREFPYVFRDRKSGYSKLSAFVAVSYLESLFELRFGFSPLDRLREKYHRGRYKIVEGMLGGGTLLDVGCGRPCDSMPDGALLEHLGRGVGLDIKACVGRSEFVRGGLLQMPFRSGAFDRVSALEVLEHMDDLPAALAEVDRVLKPGGVFVVSVPDDNLAWKCIWWVWVKLIGRMWRHTHHTHFQAAQWRRVLSERFDVVSFRRHWYFDLVFQLRRRG